jgi:hypothetical protein
MHPIDALEIKKFVPAFPVQLFRSRNAPSRPPVCIYIQKTHPRQVAELKRARPVFLLTTPLSRTIAPIPCLFDRRKRYAAGDDADTG